jgi:hydrogenase-4 component J
MKDNIVFYRLMSKFVNHREDIPEKARQVVYYTLAVGHHVGVLDCFTRLFVIPMDNFQEWIDALPETDGKTKITGILKWGEIEINRNHVGILQELLDHPISENYAWKPIFQDSLKSMLIEPAFYMMVKRQYE